MTLKLVRLTVMSATCLLPAACATTSYTRSGVAALPPGAKGKAGSDAALEIEGLRVRIESLDYAKKGESALPSLALRLVFEPRELGYSFDPEQVRLRTVDGTTWRPRASGPGRFATGPWTCTDMASPAEGEARYHVLAPGSCFDLAYDTVLGRDARVELSLGGLARGPRRIEPVSLTLARRSGRSIDRVYWLEVLLAPLALAGGGM